VRAGPRRDPLRPDLVPDCLVDEVGLVDHACGLAASDAHEYALVQPVELGRRGLDLGRGAEGVLSGRDVLAAPETGEDLGPAMPNTSGLHVEEVTALGLQRVADVAEGGAIGQDGLPICARTRKEPPVDL